MTAITTLDLPSALRLTLIDSIRHVVVDSGFAFLRYVRDVVGPSYVWLGSRPGLRLPLLPADLGPAAGEMEKELAKICRTNQGPMVLIIRDAGGMAVVGTVMDLNCEMQWSAAGGNLSLVPVRKQLAPRTA